MSDPGSTSTLRAKRRRGVDAFWLLLVTAGICSPCGTNAQTRYLDDYLRIAESNSPLLKDQAYQREALALDSSDIRAAFGLQVNGSSQFLYAPNGAHWGYDPAITNGGLYSAVVGASVPLFTGGRKQTGLDSVALRGSALQLVKEGTLLDLRQRVTEQFINTYADQRTLAAVLARVRILDEEEAVMKHLVGQGIYQQIDGMNLRVNAQAQRIAASRAKALLRNDLLTLSTLCGSADTAMVALAPLDLAPPGAFDPSASPGMRQFAVDSLAINIADRSIDLNYRARLNVIGEAGLNAVVIRDVPDRFGASAGLNLSMPIYDGNRRRTQHDRIALREKSRTAYRDSYADQLELRHAQLSEALAQADTLIAGTLRQSADEEHLIELYRVELERGLVRLTDLFLALENHARTVNDMIQTEADRSRIVNALMHLQ
ncbi:MAG: TolC family protein [Flavobacteriales bacterium]|nr:TolC family protein [Flavobacteriales bacterium]